jgi:hypothetical protein
MQVGFWVVTAAVFAMADLGVVLSWFYAVVLLRQSQEEMTRTRLFRFARRSGLKASAAGLARMIARRDCRALTGGSYPAAWRRAGRIALMVPLAAGFAGAMSVILLSFLPAGKFLAGGWLPRTAVTAGVLSTVTASWFWLSGLAYAARSGLRGRGRLPRLAVPGLSAAARDDLALRVYWYSALRRVGLVAVCTPWVLLNVATAGSSQPPAPAWYVVLFVVLWVSFLGAAFYGFYRALVFDRLASEVCWLLDPATALAARRQGPPLSVIADPLRFLRAGLARTAGHLDAAAWSLDARQVRGTAPHPVSTLFRSAARDIRQFLRSKQSWAPEIPGAITALLQSVAVLLAMPADPGSYQELARRIPAAFDGDGNPAAEPERRPPGRIATAVSRATEGAKGIAAVLTAIGLILGFVIAWALFAFHKMNITDVLSHM